jgi:Protein of unknown function (DUF2842)
VRFRKLIGAVALFVLVLAWALVAMAVAQFPAIRDTTVLLILYYVIAGCGLGVAGNAADFSYHQHQRNQHQRNHSLDT